jgi:hypothetical protein
MNVTSGKLPWSTADSEAEAGVFRKEIGGPPELKLTCEGVGAPTGFSEGGMAPLIRNSGHSIGAGPNELTIEGTEASKLKNGTESLEIGGGFKFEGYTAQELIAVKSP